MAIPSRRPRRLGAVLASAALGWLVAAAGVSAGYNGTLKIHESDTPNGTSNNDPKACTFNVEAFGLDAGQAGYLVFVAQEGETPRRVSTPDRTGSARPTRAATTHRSTSACPPVFTSPRSMARPT